MSIESAGLQPSMNTNHSNKTEMESLKKLMDAYKDISKVTDTKRQDVISSLDSLFSELQKGAEHMNPPAFHAIARQATDVLDKIGVVDPEFLTEAVEELTDSKGKKNKLRSLIDKKVQTIEVTAATQFLAIHQVKGTVSYSSSSQSTSGDDHHSGDYHPALNNVEVKPGIEDRLDLGEITGFVMKQQRALVEAGVLPGSQHDGDDVGDYDPALNNVEVKPGIEDRLELGEITGMAIKQQISLENVGGAPPAVDIDPNIADELTLGGIIKLSMQLREARSAQRAEGNIEVKSFYTAGGVMMDLMMQSLDHSDAEGMIRALLAKPFLSDEDIILIMDLLGDLGFSVSLDLINSIKEKLSDFLEFSAQSATSPTDFLMIAEIVKMVSDSSLGDIFDEHKLIQILDGNHSANSSSQSIEAMSQDNLASDDSNVDSNINAPFSTVGDSGAVGSLDSPVDINVFQVAAAAANQQVNSLDTTPAISDDEELTRVHGVDASDSHLFMYNFTQSVTAIVENFIRQELDSTLDNFAFDMSDTPSLD